MRRLTHLLVLGAFVLSCGGNWAVLQCVAWVSMIHEYSEMVPLTEAVGMTLSGKYPCAICKAIAEKKQSDNVKALTFEKFEKQFAPSLDYRPLRWAATTVDYPDLFTSLQSGLILLPPRRPARS